MRIMALIEPACATTADRPPEVIEQILTQGAPQGRVPCGSARGGRFQHSPPCIEPVDHQLVQAEVGNGG